MDNLSSTTISRHLDDYIREQQRLMNELKTSKEDGNVTKELSILTSLINNLVRLRTLKQKQSE